MEVFYFLKDNTLFKTVVDYDQDSANPRDPNSFSNFGIMWTPGEKDEISNTEAAPDLYTAQKLLVRRFLSDSDIIESFDNSKDSKLSLTVKENKTKNELAILQDGKTIETFVNDKEGRFQAADFLLENASFGDCCKTISTKACVVPILYSDFGGGNTKYYTPLDAVNYDEPSYQKPYGFIFASEKDIIKEVQAAVGNKLDCMWLTNPRQAAFNCLKDEIAVYNMFTQGEVYQLGTEVFDKSRMEWVFKDSFGGVYPSIGNEHNTSSLIKDCYKLDSLVSEKDALVIQNTVTQEFKTEVFKDFLSAVRNNLKMFDGNIRYSSLSVLNEWKSISDLDTSSSLSPAPLKLRESVINTIFTENKCTDIDSVTNFISSKLNDRDVNARSSMSFVSKDGNRVLYKRHQYGGVDVGIIFNNNKKTFALFGGAGSPFISPDWVKTTKKDVLNTLKSFHSAGYRECTIEGYENCQITSKSYLNMRNVKNEQTR